MGSRQPPVGDIHTRQGHGSSSETDDREPAQPQGKILRHSHDEHADSAQGRPRRDN